MGTIPQIVPVLIASVLLGALFWRLSSDRSKQIAINVAVFAALLGTADVALRIFADGFLHYRSHERFSRPAAEHPALSRYKPMVDVTTQERGDLGAMKGDPALAEPRKVRFSTDQLGFRNSPISSEPYDLLIIGDSFAVGIGTSQEETFPALLQRENLGRAYSLSMPGGPWEGYANLSLLRHEIPLKANATLLWVIFPGNDFEDHYHRLDVESLRKPSLVARATVAIKAWRQRSFVGHVLRRATRKGSGDSVIVREHAGNKLLFYQPYDAARRRTVAEWEAHQNAPAFVATLDAMRRLARDSKLNLTLAIVPSKEEVYGWILDPSTTPDEAPSAFSRYLAGVARTREVPVIDLGPDLAREGRELASKGRFVYWRDDTHLNSTGHEIVARTLARALSPAKDRKGSVPK